MYGAGYCSLGAIGNLCSFLVKILRYVMQRGQRSLCEAPQPERPGMASDGKGGHPGVERAVRPAQN